MSNLLDGLITRRRFHLHRDSHLHPCGTNVLPPARIIKIMSRVGQLSALRFCQAREFLSLLGPLNSMADQIPHGMLHLRPPQFLLLSRWRPHQDPLDREVPLPESLLREVLEFLRLRDSPQTGSAVASTPSQTLHVHRRVQFQLGRHVNEVDLTTKGTWSREESKNSRQPC
jgi:hypothetical protein